LHFGKKETHTWGKGSAQGSRSMRSWLEKMSVEVERRCGSGKVNFKGDKGAAKDLWASEGMAVLGSRLTYQEQGHPKRRFSDKNQVDWEGGIRVHLGEGRYHSKFGRGPEREWGGGPRSWWGESSLQQATTHKWKPEADGLDRAL